MAAHLDFNDSPKAASADKEAATLLAWLNFCFDNLQIILQKAIDNKKTSDLQKDMNDIMMFVSIVTFAMQQFQQKINQDLFMKEQIEEYQTMEKQIEAGESRLAELNRMLEQYVADNLAVQQRLQAQENEYLQKREAMLKERNEVLDNIRKSEFKIQLLDQKISQLNHLIGETFREIINDVSNQLPPYELHIDGKTLTINPDEASNRLNTAFDPSLADGSLKEGEIESKVHSSYTSLGFEKIEKAGIEKTAQAVQVVKDFANEQTSKFMNLFRGHKDASKLKNYMSDKQDAEVERAQEQIEVEKLRDKRDQLNENIEVLDQNHQAASEAELEQTSVTLTSVTTQQDTSTLEDVDDELGDPFAESSEISENDERENDAANNNRNDPGDDEFPSPPGDPDNRDIPNQPPPAYVAADAPLQQPEPSAPPQEEVDFPAPSAPPPEELAIPNEPSPVYVGRNEPVNAVNMPMEPVNNIEAKIAGPLSSNENKSELKNQNEKAPNSELKEIKSSGGILGRLGVTAESLQKHMENKKTEAAVSQGRENKQPSNQGNLNIQNQQNEPVEPEIKGPGRRR